MTLVIAEHWTPALGRWSMVDGLFAFAVCGLFIGLSFRCSVSGVVLGF